MTEIFQNSLFPTKKNVFPLVPEANNLPFSFFDQQASNIHIQNFQNFLKLVKDIFTSKTEENFINTLENLKTPYYKLENSQDLQEIYQLYINTYFPSRYFSNNIFYLFK